MSFKLNSWTATTRNPIISSNIQFHSALVKIKISLDGISYSKPKLDNPKLDDHFNQIIIYTTIKEFNTGILRKDYD